MREKRKRSPRVGEPIAEALASIERRREACWQMAAAFLEKRDAHGLMDIGAELQSLIVAERTLKLALGQS